MFLGTPHTGSGLTKFVDALGIVYRGTRAVEDLKRILEPFEHAGRAQDHATGAGLGLTLVNAFAELQMGRLEIQSDTGKGFKATLLMPKAT